MKVEILSAAEAELADAVAYYNGQSEGLGYEFAAEIRQTIARILQFPDAWMRLSARTHSQLLGLRGSSFSRRLYENLYLLARSRSFMNNAG